MKESTIRDHLLIRNNIPYFDELTILAYGYHICIFEIKESLAINCDRPVLNKNIRSAKLFLFCNNWNFECFYDTVTLFYFVI